jgi:hypothetical protein
MSLPELALAFPRDLPYRNTDLLIQRQISAVRTLG